MSQNAESPSPERICSPKEVADRLSIHPTTLRRAVRQGKITGVHIGLKRIGILQSEVERCLQQASVTGRLW